MSKEKKLEVAKYILTLVKATDEEITPEGKTPMYQVYFEWEQQWRKALMENCADLKEYFGWIHKAQAA